MRAILSLILAAGLSACATTRDRASLDDRDPYERFNRGVWEFNQAIDKVAVKPAATVYRTVTPIPARRGIGNFFSNLAEPFSAVNNLLQGKVDRFFNSIGRFLINTTIGVGGLADHATELGLPETREDFGQTLAKAGARKSPYLVLPLLGPSTVRDAIGTAVQFVADPATIVLDTQLTKIQSTEVTVTRLLDARAGAIDDGVDAVLDTSADPYATARSAYFQRREAQIEDRDGAAAGSGTGSDQEQLDKALKDAQPTDAAPPTEQPQDSTPPAASPAPTDAAPAPPQPPVESTPPKLEDPLPTK